MKKEIVQGDIGKICELLKNVLKTEQYEDVQRMGGLTNRTYKVRLKDGGEYVVRIPGEGTEELIVRRDERVSTELACSLGIDARLLYFGDDGCKVTCYIPNALTMTAETLREERHIRQVADIFRTLHTSGADTGVPFEVFDMAAGYEKIIRENNVDLYEEYPQVKDAVMRIKEEVEQGQEIGKVPCHNDSLCENWVEGNGRMYLIDWEYAGMNDPMWDLADISIEAAYDASQDRKLLDCYFGTDWNSADYRRFTANKIYLDYLWTLWGKTRVPYDGKEMEEYAYNRYVRLKHNIAEYQKIKEGC